ncbi:hypothetical protein CVS40_11676 [Lucilia cuprina]|nr:hypothetical protein CVS40_11676 [Lucilia cuprina]
MATTIAVTGDKLFRKMLQNKQLKRPFTNIYFQLSMLHQQINSLYGPAIFVILVSLLLNYSLTIYSIISLSIHSDIGIFSFQSIFEIRYCISLFVDMFLYFLICDRMNQTSKETSTILMEYYTRKQNQEIDCLCLGRSVLQLNINICDIIDIDFKSLLSMLSSIFMFIIIITQVQYKNLFR